MSQTQNQANNSWTESLKTFFQPDCKLPVEETLEVLRQQNVAAFFGSADQGKKGIAFLFDSYKHAIEAQSFELSILKGIETHIRRGTLTDEILRNSMENLDKVRQENMEKLVAMQAQGKKGG